MEETGTGTAEYMQRLSVQRAALYESGDEGSAPERTIARVLQLTLDQLSDEPLAVQIMRLLAWYASQDIPKVLLGGLAAPQAVTHALERL